MIDGLHEEGGNCVDFQSETGRMRLLLPSQVMGRSL